MSISNRIILPGLVLIVACASPPATTTPEEELGSLAEAVLSPLDGELALAGLEQPVEVLRDPWGVAHIYAESVPDLFFAQGFVAAQDRLWQMDWWRRFGEGRLSEILGPVALQHDRFARLLRYRGDMEAEWTSYHPDGERIIKSFVAGVNAYIAQVRDNPPVEFQLTGIRPEPWADDVPLLRMAGLAMTGDNLRELSLARAVAELGAEEANRQARPEPWRELTVPPGVDYGMIPEDYSARTVGPRLPTPPLAARFEALLAPPETVAALAGAGAAVATRAADAGSNNWVVSGSLTASGVPLLANDPHRSITLPSLRYLVHLNAPGWNVIGSGEPALPGVAIGHNERIAWGLTIVGIDQGDIVIERLNPDNADQVWHEGQWQDLEIIEETIDVAREEPRSVRLKFSHHGPILYEDLDNDVAWAFRTVLSEPGTAGYLGSLSVDQAGDWDEYVAALDAWKVPSENMIYADIDGNIGWLAAGLAPRRDGWTGRLPVLGNGDFEWRGFRETLELPHELNPERGYIATANHNIMPPGYEPPLGYRWSSPVRYERIVEVLEGSADMTIEDFRDLQLEVYSTAAAGRVARLREVTFGDETAERARTLLAEWDARLTPDSGAAALYKAWESALGDLDVVGGFPEASPDQLATALVAAVAALEAEHGADWSAWRWGDANSLAFEHPLVDAYDLERVDRPGDRTTVNLGARAHGASFREIIDLSDWDRSLATSTPGQSGQPGSPHYGDLLPMWARGEYFPLLYTREAVEERAAHRLLLRPAAGR